MSVNPEPMVLDVRPLLARGVEPFGAIVEAKSQLSPGQSFILRAPFEPVPLYALFQEDDYQVDVKKHAEGDWEIRFIPISGGVSEESELDLRSLEPFEHLRKAMEAVRALGRDDQLVLHSSARPTRILEQLEKATTDFDSEEASPNHWVTTIWRIAL